MALQGRAWRGIPRGSALGSGGAALARAAVAGRHRAVEGRADRRQLSQRPCRGRRGLGWVQRVCPGGKSARLGQVRMGQPHKSPGLWGRRAREKARGARARCSQPSGRNRARSDQSACVVGSIVPPRYGGTKTPSSAWPNPGADASHFPTQGRRGRDRGRRRWRLPCSSPACPGRGRVGRTCSRYLRTPGCARGSGPGSAPASPGG